MNEEERKKLFEIIPPKFKLINEVLCGSGLRIGELINLKVKDITYEGDDKGKIKTIGKGNKFRLTSLTNDVTDNVSKFVNKKELGLDDWLFKTKSGC